MAAAAAAQGVDVNRLGEHVVAPPRAPALLLGDARESEPALRAAARELTGVL